MQQHTHSGRSPQRPPISGYPPLAWLQPDGRAGTVNERVNRRHPSERRQQERPVLLDIRGKRERRRRPLPPGIQLLERRRYPEPPLGIDEWA